MCSKIFLTLSDNLSICIIDSMQAVKALENLRTFSKLRQVSVTKITIYECSIVK